MQVATHSFQSSGREVTYMFIMQFVRLENLYMTVTGNVVRLRVTMRFAA